jgi:single-strand DNA-binding protein
MLNNINVQGRFTADPELKRTSSSTFTTFTIASQRRKDSNGNYETDFINCIAWGTQAEFIARWFHKGSMAIVSGRLQSRNFETSDGHKRTAHEVFTYECNFAGDASNARKPDPTDAPEMDDAPALDFEF